MPLQHHENHDRFAAVFPVALIISAVFVALGLLLEGPLTALHGLKDIVTRPDLLITDYVQTSGLGATLLNAGLVTAVAATGSEQYMASITLKGSPSERLELTAASAARYQWGILLT